MSLLLVGLMLCLGMGGCTQHIDKSQTIVVDGDISPEAMEAHLAQQMYLDAWQTVQEDYIDPKFNGQNWQGWKDRYRGSINTYDDAYVAIDTMLASLNDEYTRFLKPRDMKEQNQIIDSRLYGIGVRIQSDSGKLQVVQVLEETPASKAGMKNNDRIIEIDGKPTTGITVEDAADLIRGPKGSQVVLTVRRSDGEDNESILTKKIVRDEIKIKSVYSKAVDNENIGYVRLSSFMSETVEEELHEAFTKMMDKKAVIFDLRGNYGGLLSNAIAVTDMFLDQGTIVKVDGRRDHENHVYVARLGQEVPKKPMVVLIDGGSASASEIVSGALKDHHRAVLIGTTTFGKGLVQKIAPLAHQAGMNITISRYLTPKGTNIHKKGISPDIEVKFTDKDLANDRDPQLRAAINYLSKELASRS